MADKMRRAAEKRHIRVYHDMTGTLAWEHLSGNAIKVLLHLVRFDNGELNGKLFYSDRTAAEGTGLSRNTCRRALAELVEKGFLAVVEKGHFDRKVRHATVYRYTWQAAPGVCGPTHDYRKWRPDDGKARVQNLNGTGAKSATDVETSSRSGAKSAPDSLETSRLSVGGQMSGIEPQISYHGRGSASEPIIPWKQGLAETDSLAVLRRCASAWVERHGHGAQSKLSDKTGIPGGTLSKFMSGRGLPERHRNSLSAALGNPKGSSSLTGASR